MSPDDLNLLLRMARESLRFHFGVEEGVVPEPTEALKETQGLFVTLRRRDDDELRGCIGFVRPDKPLWKSVINLAVGAATRDNRFQPVTIDELDDLFIELSVLSPFEQISGPEQIEIGRHGLYVRSPHAVGVLLPQVATSRAWGPEKFLSMTCVKAGLPEEEWKTANNGLEIFTFSAQLVEES